MGPGVAQMTIAEWDDVPCPQFARSVTAIHVLGGPHRPAPIWSLFSLTEGAGRANSLPAGGRDSLPRERGRFHGQHTSCGCERVAAPGANGCGGRGLLR